MNETSGDGPVSSNTVASNTVASNTAASRLSEAPQNPLHERYASREMARLFSAQHRFRTWRRIWVALAESQQALGLDISDQQLDALRAAQDTIDLERVVRVATRIELFGLLSESTRALDASLLEQEKEA